MKFRSKIITWGNSLGLRVPLHLVRRHKLTSGDVVEISSVEDGFIVKKIQPLSNRTILELFEGYESNNRPLVWDENDVE